MVEIWEILFKYKVAYVLGIMDKQLSKEERQYLLSAARQAIECTLEGRPLPEINLNFLSENLSKPGASFVTLTKFAILRGCVGTLEAKIPLLEDVRQHAIAAAFQDFRFPPVQKSELIDIRIEISRLSTPQLVQYHNSEELLGQIDQGKDGILIMDGISRATFLPQVWKKFSDKTDFMKHLCVKMGVEPDYWRHANLCIYKYQVEIFEE